MKTSPCLRSSSGTHTRQFTERPFRAFDLAESSFGRADCFSNWRFRATAMHSNTKTGYSALGRCRRIEQGFRSVPFEVRSLPLRPKQQVSQRPASRKVADVGKNIRSSRSIILIMTTRPNYACSERRHRAAVTIGAPRGRRRLSLGRTIETHADDRQLTNY